MSPHQEFTGSEFLPTAASTPATDRPAPDRSDVPTSDENALKWANSHVEIGTSSVISDHPWGKTFRLTTNDDDVILKVLPAVLAPAVNTVRLLSERFPESIPGTVACNEEAGLLLMKSHCGSDLASKPDEACRTAILATYADIQSRSSADTALMDGATACSVGNLVTELVAFLDPDEPLSSIPGARIHASAFFSPRRCKAYAHTIRQRSGLIESLLKAVDGLPDTINHGDLRPANVALRDGKPVIFDWDESVRGPAGLSLHAMFSGTARLLQIVEETPLFTHPESLRQPRRELRAYLSALELGGYANTTTLPAAIAGAALAGMMLYLVGFSRFEYDSKSYRRTVRRNLGKRLSDLLDVCDYLSITRNEDILSFAQDYRETGRDSRAKRLLKEHLRLRPDDIDALTLLADIYLSEHRFNTAIKHLDDALQITPDTAALHARAGEAYKGLGDFKRAVRHYRRSLALLENQPTRRQLEHVQRLSATLAYARRPGTVPTVELDGNERDFASPDADTLRLCERLFRRHGVLHIRNLYDPELLRVCHEAFLERYHSYLTDTRHKDALRIGDKRFQVTIDIAHPYDTPALYGNPLVVSLMQRLVGSECILGCFTSAMSLPGSDNQRLHKDHKALFFDDPEAKTLPSFAVTVMVPLVDTNELVGTTRVKKGSHRLTTRQSESLPYQTPLATVGDCYLMDYRLSHYGQANRSESPRPILSMVYQRPWFRDYINFNQQPSLRIDADALDRVPENLKSLLAWTAEPGPRS